MGFLFVLVFILGIIFVLLPFLENTPPPSAVPAAQARPRPQIFTSNPLTTLVKRIVNALQTEWDKKREKRRLAVARMQGKRKLAPTNYRAALLKTLPSQEEAPGEPIELPQGEDDGNWLIAPQISPEDTAAKGMHEVSITDEPAQSTETITIPLPQEAAAFSVQSEGLPADSAMQDAPVQLARANSVLDIPLPTSATPEQPSQKAPMGETEKAWQELQAIIYPEKKIEETIRKMADVKFALLPDTPKTQREKETFIKEKTEKTIKEFRRLRWDEINRLLESDEPAKPTKDYLGNYFRSAQKEGKPTNPIPVTVYSKDKNGNATATSFEFPSLSPGDLRKIVDSPDATPESETESTGGSSRPLLSVIAQVFLKEKMEQQINALTAGRTVGQVLSTVGKTTTDFAATLGATTGEKFLEEIPPRVGLPLDEKSLDPNANISEIRVEPLKTDLSIREDLTAMPSMKKSELEGIGSEEFNKDTTELAGGSGEQAKRDATLDGTFEGSLIGMDLNGNINFYDPKEALQQALEKIQNPLSVVGTNYARNHK